MAGVAVVGGLGRAPKLGCPLPAFGDDFTPEQDHSSKVLHMMRQPASSPQNRLFFTYYFLHKTKVTKENMMIIIL